ncbi:MAG: GHKL domain-containing protein [Synechococcales cyanobacterium RU_4_20]|nr:GHKL domain-containing protein [Synechococcales cyanobacterium RU_4_20]
MTDRETQLQTQNVRLEAEVESLKAQLTSAEVLLLQQEKMAALGELMAGTAHEINTPLGAIQASIWNIHRSLERSLTQLPVVLEQLSPELWAEFQLLLSWAQTTQEPESSREERQLRRQICQSLADLGVAEAADLAPSLSQMGLTQSLEPVQQLLLSPQAAFAIETIYNIAAIHSNSHNIQVAAERANRIVAALKGYARRGDADQKIRASIAVGIDTALTLYHNQIKHDIELTKHYEAVPEILCYPEELLQVWSNLVGNALQAMGGKGSLAIAVSQTTTDLAVSITDSGPGISLEDQQKIFTPFFTTKPSGEGCGLGLSIVSKILDKHNGRIELQSEPGKTEFRVFLPLDRPGEHPSQVPPPSA